jgi:hypothetical protein
MSQGGGTIVKRITFFVAIVVLIVALSPVLSLGAETARLVFLKAIYTDEKGGSLKYPDGLACDDTGRLIVADSQNNRLVRYTVQDGDVKGGTEIKIPQLSFPIKVQVNSKGEIFVLNGKPLRLLHLGPEGQFIGYMDLAELPAPSSFVPKNFRIDAEDNIYILDVFSGRVIVLTPDGKFKSAIAFPKEYGFFADLAVDSAGNVLLIDALNAQIFSATKGADTFSPLTKSEKEFLKFPTSITTDKRGLIYVVDQNGAGIAIFAKDGTFLSRQLSFGWNEGLLRYPAQLCIDDKDHAFIDDRANDRVQIFTINR